MYPELRIDGMVHNPYMMGYGYPTYGMGYHMTGYPSYGMMHHPWHHCCYPHYTHHHHGHHHHWHPHHDNTQMQAQSMSINMPGMMHN
ncbi:hypothetical protein NSQ59_04395 [Margalitia sp. FSL K6-0131]|uniref:hypothetical protein n=1 Tax=Margalitia sp. FSL K6-0131 TaxID=2954604 RepID=UPI0030F573D8